MADLVDDFLNFKQGNQGRAASTLDKYRDALGRLKAYLGEDRELESASADELLVFTGPFLHKCGISARSRKPFVAAVREFYKWLKERGHTKSNVASAVPYPRSGRPLPKGISLVNAEKIMWGPDMSTFVGVRDAAMLSVLIGCGIRVSGLVGLNESSLSNASHNGQVRMVVRVNEKGGRERVLPVPVETELMLRVYLEHPELKAIERSTKDGGQVLFVTVRNTRCAPHEYHGERRRFCRKGVWEVVKKYGRKAGIPEIELRPHAFRHLFGTELTEGGVPTLTTQDLMGHADAKSTAIYIHLASRNKQEAVDKHGPMAKIRTPISDLVGRLNSAAPRA